MSDRQRQQWEALGAGDPYWAVLAAPRKKDDGWDKEEFFHTGTDEVNGLLQRLSYLGIKITSGLALDYGCGVGRLSRALAQSFQRVVGVDFSAAMLAEAQSANAAYPNIQFLHNNGNSLSAIAGNSVDLVYSVITLQHVPRTDQRALIMEFCRVLRPEGVLVFQTLSRPSIRTLKGWLHLVLSNGVLNIGRKIRHGSGRVMELYTIKKQQVLQLLTAGGMSVLEVERYDAAGKAFIGYRYYAVKH
jgi:ubiquinone/menaquinone biosynthesis C-methylase UbiE